MDTNRTNDIQRFKEENKQHGGFKYGTIGEQWKQIQSERWLNPAFENFVNREIMGARSSQQQSPAS